MIIQYNQFIPIWNGMVPKVENFMEEKFISKIQIASLMVLII
jgi:hypothetical protein